MKSAPLSLQSYVYRAVYHRSINHIIFMKTTGVNADVRLLLTLKEVRNELIN